MIRPDDLQKIVSGGRVKNTYMWSKLAMAMFAFEIHRRYAARGVSAAAVNPGQLLY